MRLVVAILAMTACGDGRESASGAVAIDTLANGAVHVRNVAEGAWDSAAAWRFVEDTRIGSMEGTGPDVFAEVRDIEVDGYGRLWILDAQQKKIEVFAADGRHVRTVGRPGAGPGELEYPIGLELDPQGRVWVLDPRNSRFTVFDTAGALVATHRRESTYTPWRWEGGITRDGRVFDTSTVYGAAPPGRDVLIERDSSGTPTDTIDLPAIEMELYELRIDGRLMQTTPVPFTPRLDWKFGNDGTLWFGTTDDYRLINQTLSGDTLRIIEKAWTPVAVSAEDRAEWLGMESLAEMRRLGAVIDEGRIPQTKPAWSAFWVDDEGYLWVRPTRAEGSANLFDVFDPEGRYLGVASFSALDRASAPLIRGDRAYVVVMDELDVPYVVAGRLEGRD